MSNIFVYPEIKDYNIQMANEGCGVSHSPSGRKVYTIGTCNDVPDASITKPSLSKDINRAINDIEGTDQQKRVALLIDRYIKDYINDCGNWCEIHAESSVDEEVVIGRHMNHGVVLIVVDRHGDIMVSVKDDVPKLNRRYFVDYEQFAEEIDGQSQTIQNVIIELFCD